MANQRMFIRCKACGDEKFLAKRMMSNFYPIAMKTAEWEAWFRKHEWGFCDPEDGDWGLDVFELSYEHHVEGGPSKSDGGA